MRDKEDPLDTSLVKTGAKILVALEARGPMSAFELQAVMGVERTSIGTYIHRMARYGYTARTKRDGASPTGIGRRKVTLWAITKKGRRALGRARKLLNAYDEASSDA